MTLGKIDHRGIGRWYSLDASIGKVKRDVYRTLEQFKEISLRRGESTFKLAEDRGIGDEEIARLRLHRNQVYVELLQTQSCVIDGVLWRASKQ